METYIVGRTKCELPRGSYRTYEEWKLEVVKMGLVVIICSYRTYEEWKPVDFNKSSAWFHCSYRTYEEWKQESKEPQVRKEPVLVLTVPMRNGNT